jgi:hypothetical protein
MRLFKEKVHSATLIYKRWLSFNHQPQNQVLHTHKLSKPSYLSPSVHFEVVFAYVAPHQGGFCKCGVTSAKLMIPRQQAGTATILPCSSPGVLASTALRPCADDLLCPLAGHVDGPLSVPAALRPRLRRAREAGPSHRRPGWRTSAHAGGLFYIATARRWEAAFDPPSGERKSRESVRMRGERDKI